MNIVLVSDVFGKTPALVKLGEELILLLSSIHMMAKTWTLKMKQKHILIL